MPLDELLSRIFYGVYKKAFSEVGKRKIREYADTYGDNEVITAFNIAIEQYSDPITAFNKIGGILYNRDRTRRIMLKGDNEQ